MMPASASSPSVNAAGPACRMSGDLISRRKPSRTAGTSANPGRAATLAGTNFLPHQVPTMMSGLAAINSSPGKMPALAVFRRGDRGIDAAAGGDLNERGGLSVSGNNAPAPSLEKARGMAFGGGCAGARLREPPLQRFHQRVGLAGRADQRAERADHVENAGDVALVEGMDRDVAADQLRGEVGLQVGGGDDEVRVEREDFPETRGSAPRPPPPR